MDTRFSYSVRGFAERHSVSRATVHRWIKDGKLNSLKIGNLRRITLDNERAFLIRHAANNKFGGGK